MKSNTSFGPSHLNQIIITATEHSLSNRSDLGVEIASWVSLILIYISNGYLIHVMKNQMKSGMDWLILMDSVLCIISSIHIIMFGHLVDIENPSLCFLITFFLYFTTIANKLVTVSIGYYRYVFVVK